MLLLFSLTYFGLGLLAGGDFTRIVFLGFPFIMTLILLSAKESAKKEVLLALILSIPVMRLEGTIPDIGTAQEKYYSWFPAFASVRVVLLWLLYALVVGIVQWWINKKNVAL
ncbi:MAG: hypothetical protein V4714_09990 [Bacteroidota bacterium]